MKALVALVALVVGVPATALAHGDIKEASPAAGTEVPNPPAEISLVLAEPAAKGSSVVVTDGCGDEVSGQLDIRRAEVATAIDGGQAGRWDVDLRSISAIDGHLVKERYSFRVSGEKDCNGLEEPEDTEISPGTSSRPPIHNPDDPTSFPVIPFALGTVAVVAVALAVRQPWNRS